MAIWMVARDARNDRHVLNFWLKTRIWGCSSVGRALPSQGRGRGFESPHLQHNLARCQIVQSRKRADHGEQEGTSKAQFFLRSTSHPVYFKIFARGKRVWKSMANISSSKLQNRHAVAIIGGRPQNRGSGEVGLV